MKTYSQKAKEVEREWWVIDASTLPLGKLAVVIADKLMGKSKVTYTPHIDGGVIREAVKGMLPKNKLAAERLKRLRVFEGSEHAHTAQNPKEIK